MPREHYPPRISTLKEQIETHYADDFERTIDCCETLEQYAYEVDSDELRAYCQLYKGLTLYLHAQLDRGYNLLTRCIDPLCQTEQWELVGKAYNSLGNIASFQGELSLAVDHFFTGLRFCKEHQLTEQTYRIINNIADMYISLGEFGLAVEQLKICAEGLADNPKANAIIFGNLAYCYIHLEQLDEAEKYLNQIISCHKDDMFDRCSILFLQASLYHSKGDLAKCNEIIELLRDADISSIIYDFLNEIEHHARLLVTIERYDALEELLAVMDRELSSLFARETLCKLKLEYYQKIGAEQEYLKQAAEFYKISEQREQQRRKLAVHNIITRSSLEKEMDMRAETERDNTMLRERSEKDALTGIKNRFKLNEVSEKAFQRAYMNGTMLGIELLDIDYYKEYNDNYGHQAGDECLITIARVLQEQEQNKGIHVGRYGGDEFMIIYEGYSKEEILAFASRIKEKLTALQVEHKHSRVAPYVTVSQGIFVKVPEGVNRLWDFTYCADLCLYYIKRKNRNDFFLSSTVQEIREFAGNDYRHIN
ncbi:MAG: diguanylate cyclase [Oscillospiraceae bacterium]|nr:diguanylate cyclase [Oscillospiraceae bacterium]